MATPVIADLPPAPTRGDGAADFSSKADALVGALQPLVLQVNIALQWIAGQLTAAQAQAAAAAASAVAAAASATAANASKVAAAQSAIDATSNGAAQVALAAAQAQLATTNGAAQVALAATQAQLATNNGAAQVALAAAQVALAAGLKADTAGLRDQAQIIADAARAAVGIPSYLLKPGYVFEVNDDATGIRWGTRHKIGDAILTARDMDASYLPLAGGTYLQSAYPLLFAEVGLIGAVSGDVWSQVMPVGTIGPFKAVKRGKDGVLIAISVNLATSTYYRSTDNGATWTPLTLTSAIGNSTSICRAVSTDEKGVWVIPTYSTSATPNENIARSTDNGLTWTNVRNAAITDSIYAKSCETDANGTWIIAGGVLDLRTLRSVDNGLTWTRVQYAVGANEGSAVSCDRLGVWVIGTLGQVWRSTDNGLTWTQIGGIGFSTIYGIATNGKGVWLAVGSNSSSVNMARSPDNGLTWSNVNAGLGAETLQSVVTDYTGNWFVGTSTGRVLRSINEAQTFTVLAIATTGFLATDTIAAVLMINSDVLAFGYQSAAGNYTKGRRSNGTYPYDSATMFKLPDLRAPQGLNYLIKAKEAA